MLKFTPELLEYDSNIAGFLLTTLDQSQGLLHVVL